MSAETVKLVETTFTVSVDARELNDLDLSRMSEAVDSIMGDTESYLRRRITTAGHLRGDLITITRTEN